MWPFKRKPRHKHEWYGVSVVHGQREAVGPVTFISRICLVCQEASAVEWLGYWTLEALNHDWVASPPERKS